jgi:cytochrome P450
MSGYPDVSDPATFAEGFPHDVFRRLRDESPVHWQERDRDGARGFWIVSRYEDVKHVSKNPRLFCSERGTNIRDMQQQQGGRMMLMMDPPDHGRYRRLVSPGFTPRRIEALGSHIAGIVDAVIDNVAGKGECDFVTEVAAELPLRVIAEFLGVPEGDRHKIFDWSNRLIGFEDPEFMKDAANLTAAIEMYGYADRLAEDRLASPQDDITTLLLNAEVEGEKLSRPEFSAFFLLLAVAGNETTRNLISHGMRLLIEHPKARERLLADRTLLPSAIEEMLRFSPPVMYFRRTATQDAEIGGVPIAAGDKVTVWYPSANRDEDVFERPDVFDITRDPNDHLAFGVGEHFCLGSHLARLEIRVMFERLLERLPDIRPNGPVRYLHSHFINGVKSMPVRFTPEAT